jgi:hypothetical protein
MLAKGTFEVQMTPQQDPGPVGRMTLAKQFAGDIDGTSAGVMIAYMTETKGSAGYTAIEKVEGTILGKKGSFVLQHSSTMARGTPHQSIQVIPDSGTNELAGLSGSMVIIVEGKKHSYEFEYSIAS